MTASAILRSIPLRSILSFLGEEFLEGYQIVWSCFIGVSNILEKIIKYLMGCEILEYILD